MVNHPLERKIHPPSFPDRLIWGNGFIAGSAASWVFVTMVGLRLPLDILLILLGFALTLAFYIRDRLDRREQNADMVSMPARTYWVQRHAPTLKVIMWGAFAISVILVAMRPGSMFPLLAGAGFALSYTIRWLPWRGKRWGWKHLPGMKMPFVALLWTFTVVLTPAAAYNRMWHVATWRLAGSVWLLVMAQILLNDLRDVTADSIGGTASLPVLIGVWPARGIGVTLVLLSIPLAGDIVWPVFLVTALYTAMILWGYTPQRDSFWRPWIEGQGILAGLVVALVGYIF